MQQHDANPDALMGFLMVIKDAPPWIQNLASGVMGMIVPLAVAMIRRGEALNSAIDERIKLVLEQHELDRKYLIQERDRAVAERDRLVLERESRNGGASRT
jgi:hypothetical protein